MSKRKTKTRSGELHDPDAQYRDSVVSLIRSAAWQDGHHTVELSEDQFDALWRNLFDVPAADACTRSEPFLIVLQEVALAELLEAGPKGGILRTFSKWRLIDALVTRMARERPDPEWPAAIRAAQASLDEGSVWVQASDIIYTSMRVCQYPGT